MTFLQPIILFGLPLVLLPLIIHLINRLRHRPQPWAAMRFLISATRSSVGHARLRQFLILLLRILAVLMLLLFLARPLVGGWLGWALSPAPDAILLLLDRSPSMETQLPDGTRSKREEALELFSQAAAEFQGASHLVLVENVLRSAQELSQASSLRDIPLAEPADPAADIPAMLYSAYQWLIENRAGVAEVWIASDLQRSNWRPEDPRWENIIAEFDALPQSVRVRLLAFPQTDQDNRSISLREVVRRQRGSSSDLLLVADVQSGGGLTSQFPLIQTVNGSRSQIEFSMEGSAMRWRHKLVLNETATNGWGSLELPADANRRDNLAYFVFGAETPLRATIVSENSESGRFLELAAAAHTGAPGDSVRRISTNDLGQAVWENDTLLVWQAPLPDEATATRIRQFVEEGGAVIFFPPGRPDEGRFDGLSWGEVQEAGNESVFQVGRWDEQEGPLAKTDEGFSLPVGRTEFYRRQAINGSQNALAAFEDGVPFLSRRTIGKGEIYFCASLPEVKWSALPEGPVLVPMLQRLLQSGTRRLQQAGSVECGDLSLAELGQRWAPVDSEGKDIRFQAGVYRSGERLLAVNRPAIENEIEVVSLEETRQLFGELPFQMLSENRQRSESLQGEMWRAFVIIMLLFLLGEALLILPPKSGRGDSLVFARPQAGEQPTPVEMAETSGNRAVK